MPTAQDVICFGLKASRSMVEAFTHDLTPEESLHRPTPEANCAAWLLGHLASSDRRVATFVFKADPASLPALPDGFEARFGRDADAPKAASFGDTAILLPLALAHRDVLIAKTAAATDDFLAQPAARPSPRWHTTGEMLAFMALHWTMHAGQLSTIRRSLGRPPLF